MIRLFRVHVPASTLILLVFEIAVVILSFCGAAYFLTEMDPLDYLLDHLGLVSVALASSSFLAGLYFQDLYTEVRVKSRLLLAQQLLMVAGGVFLVQALISAIAPDLYMPFRTILVGNFLATTTLFAGRLLFNAYVRPRIAGERLLLIGESPILEDLAGHLDRNPQLGIEVAGRVRIPDAGTRHPNLEESIREFRSNGIVVGMPDARLASELLELRFSGYSIQDAAGTYAKICNREGLNGLSPARLLSSKEFEPSTRDLFFQDVVDRTVAAVCLIVLSPAMLLFAVLLRLFSHGPVLERRIRCGWNGLPFALYSFRVATSQTGLGRILIRTGIYAFPQFFNVLCGKMAIVGPKPHGMEFIAELTRYIPFYPHRFKVKPGMTGWSQIHTWYLPGPPDTLLELEYDLYYIKYAAPMMNIFVILQSIKNILVWGSPTY